MGFLDNSGDIILDAVLTDLGRERLARGDGSFKITKFALGDDEINYGNYDKNHASGSAYYDLEVLQTPILEAFTNNGSSMKSKLISLSRNDILYLPVLLINTKQSAANTNSNESAYVVAVDKNTEDNLLSSTTGVLFGLNEGSNYVQVDQGLNTTELQATQDLSSDLVETQYLIEIDNRLGTIVSEDKTTTATVSFIDDDNIAYYYLTTSDTSFVTEITATDDSSAVNGPRGTRLTFKVDASIDLQTGTSLFTRLGASQTGMAGQDAASTYNAINSTVRVSGVTTGYRLDIPVKFAKKA
tara:strand:- start:1321 stop:2217 length:897 start_codon:yes stop_codon:yes gene_type:complete